MKENGVLGFICANRWMKNRYGGPLRQKVADGFNLRAFIDLERADAFHSEVIAYPAITVIQRSSERRTLVALGNRDTAAGLDELVVNLNAAIGGGIPVGNGFEITEMTNVACRRDPWLLDAPEILTILRDLEHRFQTLAYLRS